MKKCYWIEDHRDFFSPTSYQVLDASNNTNNLLYTFECDSWGTGNWIIYKKDKVHTDKSFQVATIEREVPSRYHHHHHHHHRYPSSSSSSWWLGGGLPPRYHIQTSHGTHGYLENTTEAVATAHEVLLHIFSRRTTYCLETPNKYNMQDMTFAAHDTTNDGGFLFCSSTANEVRITGRPSSSSSDTSNTKDISTMVNVTGWCCGKTTFATTFEDYEDEDYRILFLSACVLVQYSMLEDALRLKAIGGIVSAKNR